MRGLLFILIKLDSINDKGTFENNYIIIISMVKDNSSILLLLYDVLLI